MGWVGGWGHGPAIARPWPGHGRAMVGDKQSGWAKSRAERCWSISGGSGQGKLYTPDIIHQTCLESLLGRLDSLSRGPRGFNRPQSPQRRKSERQTSVSCQTSITHRRGFDAVRDATPYTSLPRRKEPRVAPENKTKLTSTHPPTNLRSNDAIRDATP